MSLGCIPKAIIIIFKRPKTDIMKEKEALTALIEEIAGLEKKTFKEVGPFVHRNFVKTSHYKKAATAEVLTNFWTSQIPVKYFEELKNRFYFDAFLFAYFDNPANINAEFLNAFIQLDCLDNLIRILKISKGFLNDEHWNSLQFLSKKSSIKKDFHELNFIRKFLKDWDEQALLYNERLLQVSNEDLLIQTLSYFEYFKRYSTKTRDHQSQQTAYETHFISVLNDLLNYKKVHRLKNKNAADAGFTTSEFIQKTKEELPPIRPKDTFMDENYTPNEKICPTKKEVRELIDFFLQKEIQIYQIDNYLCGFNDFEYKDDDDLIAEFIVHRTRFKNYRKGLERSTYEENYFVSQVANDAVKKARILNHPDRWERQFQLNIEKAHTYFDFLSLPKEIELKRLKQPIDTKKVLHLLYSFSKLFSPQGRIITIKGEETNVIRPVIQDKFKAIFKSDYLVCYDYKGFVQKSAAYYEWSLEETDNIIDYLTADLNSKWPSKLNLYTRPFLKSGDKIIWLSSFLRDRKWETLLHKRIVNEKVENYDMNLHAADMEKGIAALFKAANFGTVASHIYPGGEFDALAFKDKTLFIVELKSTHVEEDILANIKYETLKFNSHATYQLQLAELYVRENFEEIAQITGLNINCTLAELEIKPIIVSNIFQGDGQLRDNPYPKISFLELAIILRNDRYDLYMDKEPLLLANAREYNSLNSKLRANNQSSSDQTVVDPKPFEYKLWLTNDSCSAENLISAIENNSVWQFQRIPFLGNLEKMTCQTWD
ncbi:MAG: hypothetical protein ACI8ZM_004981 [Crocinitomix sp.]